VGVHHHEQAGRSGRVPADLLAGSTRDLFGVRSAGSNYLTERLGGLEVDDQLELGRKLYRQITRLVALEDAIDIGGGATSDPAAAPGPPAAMPPRSRALR